MIDVIYKGRNKRVRWALAGAAREWKEYVTFERSVKRSMGRRYA